MPTEYNCELFRGNQPIRDAASVYYLRKGGAVLLGKTVTITLGGGDPAALPCKDRKVILTESTE